MARNISLHIPKAEFEYVFAIKNRTPFLLLNTYIPQDDEADLKEKSDQGFTVFPEVIQVNVNCSRVGNPLGVYLPEF